MPISTVNGIRLSYDVSGKGDPVVMVMGTGAGGRAWHLHQVPALVAAGYQVVTFDNRGIPPTDVCAEGFTVHDLVADTAGLVEHLGIGPCRFVGTSLGAHIVQELCLARPELVTQAALLATRGRKDTMRRARDRAELELFDSGIEVPASYAATVRAMEFLSPATLNSDRDLQDWLDLFEMSPTSAGPGYRAQLGVTMEPGRLEAYRAIRAHCLVVGFADDLVLPPHLAREVADVIPRARYTEIKNAGHYGYMERPDEVNEELIRFFSEPY
ncbi:MULTISPECIES: alpha/beta fold hydrolase [Streptomyces]|uniref:Hydrolase n=1 Tax=Streptomyces cacaoi TaxID=1898 RepID=A0A4Y3R7S3_STRCI|nr:MULTISPECIES: alpha/beta hydrolase [Streptomyces]NNG83794.1 alpha/beta fold hydrolase [Streptomyces cacaoi]QHF93407.1 alpha/beta hydrolase [Streptomyces sp. NHF165]GEB53785.1 hydrolase [Streptomyces cacaoi]